MLELLRGVAGIQAAEPGWKSVSVSPRLLDLPDLSGAAATPLGDIQFSFAPGCYRLTLPEGMTGVFRHPDGTTVPLHSGEQTLR